MPQAVHLSSMTMQRAAISKAAVLTLATLTFGTACGSVADTASTEGDSQSEVVSGESAEASEGESEGAADAEEAEATAAELSVVEHGFTQLDGGEYGEPGVTYGVVIENSGDGIAADAEIQISFLDSNGGVVDSHEGYVPAVLPGTAIALGDYVYDASGVSEMKVQVLPGTSEALEEEPANFTVSNVTTRAQEYGGLKTTAKVKSPFVKDLEELHTVAIYRDGNDKIIGGDFTYLNFVPAEGEASVTIDSFTEGLTPATTDVYVALSSLTLLG